MLEHQQGEPGALATGVRRDAARRWVALSLAVFVVLVARSMTRRFDLDEHQFVAPAVFLANDGLLPYRDYPYFHMPNLVLLYAAVMAWAPWKLVAARAIATCCGAAIVLLLFASGWRLLQGQSSKVRWAIAGGLTATLVCSRMFLYTQGWAWNHEPATLCALGAVLLYLRSVSRGELLWLCLAGFLIGNAACIRLSFAPIVIPLGAMLLLGPSSFTRWRRWQGLLLAAAGGLVASLPALYCLATMREPFLFGNLGYPPLSAAAYAAADAPAMTPLGKGLYAIRCFVTDPGNAVLLAATLASLVAVVRLKLWRGRFGHALILLMALQPALWYGATSPTPAQYQYFYVHLPFAILLVFCTLASLPVEALWRGRVLAGFRWAALAAIAIGLPRGYWRLVDAPFVDRWPPVAVHRAGEWIRKQVPAGVRIMTLDPLFPLEAHLDVFPHFAVGRFPMIVGPFTTTEMRRRQQLLWGPELSDFLCRNSPDAIYCHRLTMHLVPWLIDYATDRGFARCESSDGMHVLWVRRSSITDVALLSGQAP